MRYIFLALISVQTAFAKDVVEVIAYKKERSPSVYINEHSPNEIAFNKEYIESKPAVHNAFSLVEASGVEYQRNLQDSGGHTGVSINQLPFYYTSTFVDGIYIPDSSLDSSQFFASHAIEKIQAVRGTAATNVKPSAMAGLVEITTQNALQNKGEFSAIYGGYGFFSLSGLKSAKINKNNGVLFALTTNGQSSIDENSDRIAEGPRIRNTFATLSHNFEKDDTKIKTRIDFAKNNRAGGSTIRDKNNTTGNPFDFSRIGGISQSSWLLPNGDTESWNEGAVGLLEIIDTARSSIISSFENSDYIGGGTVSLLQRDNFYGGNKYKADEINLFGTLARKFTFGDFKIKTGGDALYQNLRSEIRNSEGVINNPDSYSYSMLSAFGQANYKLNNWDFDISSRISNHNQFGFLPSGKAKIGYHHNENISSIVAVGNGYYFPGSSFEQNHELVSGAIHEFERKITDPTEAINATYSTVLTYSKFQASIGYHYNRIKNISYFEIEHEDHAGGHHDEDLHVKFRSLNGYYQNHGITLDGIYFLNDILTINFGGERFWHNFSNLEEGFVMLSRPNYKVFTKLIAKIENHQFIFNTTLFGRQNLREFYGRLYNLQGQEISSHSPRFVIFDFDAQYKITPKYKILYGINNITNYVQIDRSPQIVLTGHDDEHHLHNRNSWGPVVGRRFYVGIKGEI